MEEIKAALQDKELQLKVQQEAAEAEAKRYRAARNVAASKAGCVGERAQAAEREAAEAMEALAAHKKAAEEERQRLIEEKKSRH